MIRHRCFDCGMVTRCQKDVRAIGVSTEEVWICQARISCVKRQMARGVQFIEVAINPPKKRRR